MKTTRILTTGALALFLALALYACGSGGSGSTARETTGGESAAPTEAGTPQHQRGEGAGKARRASSGSGAGGGKTETAPSKPSFTPPPHHDSAGGSQQFRIKGGDNSIQNYGSERPDSELTEAAAVLHAYLDARTAGAWGAACEQLAADIRNQVVDELGAVSGAGNANCSSLLASIDEGLPTAVRREAAQADVDALRGTGDSGFLIYKGARGEPFFIPMRREGGHWKVAALGPSPLG